MYAIPSIINVLLVCLVFWLIFSIMGVQFFGGKFYKCLDEDSIRLPVSVVQDKWECFQKNYSWVNSKITFDHVGHAYLALFQVVSQSLGWSDLYSHNSLSRQLSKAGWRSWRMQLMPQKLINSLNMRHRSIIISTLSSSSYVDLSLR